MDQPTPARPPRELPTRDLPIFPLPEVVLMPGALLPLHVFEPRYRALVQHVRETDGVMGVATLQPGYEDDYEGAPAIHPEIGVGELVAHQPFPDGRCNIVLQHVGQLQLVEELPGDQPFRRIRGRGVVLDTRGAAQAIARLQMMVLQLGTISPEAGDEARRLVELEDTELVDSLARKLMRTADDKRAYLATRRLVDRVAMVEGRLADFMAVVTPEARA